VPVSLFLDLPSVRPSDLAEDLRAAGYTVTGGRGQRPDWRLAEASEFKIQQSLILADQSPFLLLFFAFVPDNQSRNEKLHETASFT
jgi:hypothetical protein